MKKFIALLLVITMLLITVPSASAEEKNDYPIIVVPGYSASYLYAVEDNGDLRQIWGSFEGLNIADVILSNIAKIGAGLASTMLGRPQYLADVLSGGLNEILGDIACNPDGSPVLETVTYPNDPAVTNYRYLIDEKGSMHAAETEIMADIAEYYGDNGYENIFSFQTDFRLSIVDAIEGLKDYIDAVLEYTGAEKVNIFAVSYGGQISASYLNVYGHLGKVHNAVLTVPAIGGAALAYDVINENVRLDEETLFYFIENGMMLEEDINWLMKAHALGFLDELLNLTVKDGIKDLLGYWGSIWDFIPYEYYDELKSKYLDDEINAELIRKSDIFHYEILPTMHEKLTECIENGTNVYIVAGCDNPAVTGLYEQSDGIIHLSGATGAVSAPLGLRFSDGYSGIKTTCNDNSHKHISPAMNIDASSCYIPENTWFISGLFHGMTWKDSYTKALCTMLLFSDSPVTVHDHKNFPQFMYSTNTCHSVSGHFDNSDYGFVSDDDQYFTVTNLSEKYDMTVLSVTSYGYDITFNVPFCLKLKPGESADIRISAVLPKACATTVDVNINYILNGSITPHGSRLLTFTVNNGEAPEYDKYSPYTKLHYETEFDRYTLDCMENLLRKAGLIDYIKLLFNTFINIF